MRNFGLAAGLLVAGVSSACADTIENVGTDVAIALPLIAGGLTLEKHDWNGTGELVLDTAATVGIAYGLKHVIKETRPDGSDRQSMPSDTSALAFAPAQFLWDRYGWEYGLPAYAAAGFVAYSRVEARKHHWYDTVASAGLAFGIGKIFDTRYQGRWDWDAGVGDGGGFASVRYNLN
jgi:membrane-associated phospholipid phosphatase